MKKKLVVTLTTLAIAAVCALRLPSVAEAKSADDVIFEQMVRNDYYLSAGIITDVTNGEFVTVLLPDGNLFSFWGDGWQKGDIASIMMDGRGTPKVTDDRVLIAQPVRK